MKSLTYFASSALATLTVVAVTVTPAGYVALMVA